MRRLLVLLFSTFILLSTAAASAVGGKGGGRKHSEDHQDGSERSTAPSERERRLAVAAPPSPNPGLAAQPKVSLKNTDPSGLPTTDASSSATIHLNTRLFQTVRKDVSTTISLPTTPSPTNDTLLQEDDQSTLSKPHVPTPPAPSTASAPRNFTPVYRLGAVFEPEHIQSLSSIFFQSLQEQNRLLGGLFRLEGVAIETPVLTLSSLKGTCETLQRENVSVGLAVGVTQSIYASGTLASLAGVSLIARTIKGYRDDTLKGLLPDLVVANPRLSDLWGAATSFISALDWNQPILIHDESPQALQVAHIANRDGKHDTMGLSLSANLPRHHFQNRLSGILHTVRRLIFVSGTVNFVKVVFSHGEDLDMFNGEYIWILLDIPLPGNLSESLRPGLLSLRPDYLRTPQRQLLVNFVKSSISVISEFFKETNMTSPAVLSPSAPTQCQVPYRNLSTSQFEIHRQLKEKLESSRISQRSLPGVTPFFHVENLVKTGASTQWKRVGYINGSEVQINAIFWPGRGYKGVSEQNKRLRVALAEAPPFVMTSSLIENATCLLGVVCLRVFSPEVAATFADMEREVVNASRGYEVVCCSGLSVDLMINVATDLEIELQVYLVMDRTFGAPRTSGWTGIVGDLLDGSADLSFAPLSVTAQRARHLDFSDPYFFSSISILSSTKRMEVPLLAFLVPFSPELWIAIFVSLNITAFSVAVYEWLSPFGLNPWGRQRSKNFSYGSALWVIWGLLFSHLVAFKAPKSWPNKVLINVWGAFSVIFVASYTANIAALFAGLFQTRDHHNRNVMSLRVGALRASSAEYYVSKIKPDLWEHMKPHLVSDFTQGLQRLQAGTLDLMVGDSAVLDYLRANDPGCTLARHTEEDLVSDTFAISMGKGFPLRVKINTILARYLASGHLDHLKHKWYGELPCFSRISADLYKPQALEISTVGGVFLMLTLGIGVGIFLLFLEHLVYRYALPTLRTKPKESLWRNRNLMFFSQKLYKFINCVELVSPHHSAKELANSLRTGQIMGLFQKSVKRKENEQRRRRKSKAQFFEMIQEIRRVQKEEKAELVSPPPASTTTTTITTATGDSKRRASVPPHPPEVTPAPPSPFSSTTTTTTQAPITIDYLPGPNPHEDSEGIIVVNSSVPLGLTEEQGGRRGAAEEAGREDDSSSGILILKVSDPEEVLEANTFNQQLEEIQAHKMPGAAAECGACTCSVQEDGASRRKASGGCLNCLQRQDSTRVARRGPDGTCYPCSSGASTRENPLSPYPILVGTANGLRHRGSVPVPVSHLPSPSLRPATAPSTATPSPGVVQQTDVPEILGCATRSLEDLDARTRTSQGEKIYEGVRLVPLSQQTAIRSSGSLQLVAALSPGRERINSDLLRHVTKADLWQLWQDSEKELRVRLRQAESQRDELVRQMSKASRDHHTLTEGSSEDWDTKSMEDPLGEAKKPYGAVSRLDEDAGDKPRPARRKSRERQADEMRHKNSRRDSSTTPRKKKRQRSKSHDYLETRRSSESLEEKKPYLKSEERVTPRKHSSRRKRDVSQDRRTMSEEGPSLQRQRTIVHRSVEGAIDNTSLVDPPGEYCSTPLPLLRSLHQQTKSDAERNYAFLQSLTPERRDERVPHDTYGDQIHLKTFCREVKGRTCESDDQVEEESRLKKSDDEKLSIRRRRAGHHGAGGLGEAQARRPRERHPSRELYEGLHKRESSLQRDPRQSLPRRPYDREVRDHSSPYSGSHRHQQPQQQQQHSGRRHTTYDSSSDQEETYYSATPSLEPCPAREAHGRRQPPQHPPYPRGYEGRRPGDRMEDRRSSERKPFRDVREPP